MFASQVHAPVLLPTSHYFLTVSRGARMRTFAFRTYMVHLLAPLLLTVGVSGLGAMLYLVFHDDVVASLMARQSAMQYAYEDRIEALRGDLERQTRRQVIDQAAVERTMHDLVLRESRLENRAEIVASLATQTGTAALPRGPGTVKALFGPKSADALPEGLMGYAPTSPAPVEPFATAKPHPEAELAEPETEIAKAPGRVSMLEDRHFAVPARLSLIGASLDRLEQGQVGALSRIGAAARDETARLQGILQEAGLSADRFKDTRASGTGGPFIPLPDERDTSFGKAISDLQGTLASAIHLRGAISHVPLAKPLPGALEITSPFGARIDPFLGRPALHPGVDFRENYGADVKSTAGGRVVFAGAASGYGNMVEIDHGSGLSTRYAHLSVVGVTEGQMLPKGGILGQVGATGRATGPHLHYEVRIDGDPVDPVRFLNAGTRLAQVETH